MQSPVLTDIRLKFDGVTALKYYPAEMPDIFRGSSVTLLGRYKNSGGAKITLEGKAAGKEKKFEYSVTFPEDEVKNDFIPSLWAARRIGYLLDQIRLNGENKELIDEITQLAREHGIVTPYTSYLILEDEQRRVTSREIEADDQTLGAVAPRADLEARSKKEYTQMKDKSGAGSVRASEEFQALNKAMNIQQMNQGQSRLGFKDQSGNDVNVAGQVRKVQGRAFYNSGKTWIDSRAQQVKKARVRIQFGSKEYFELLKNEPAAAEILALGRNVRFVLKGTVYEIWE